MLEKEANQCIRDVDVSNRLNFFPQPEYNSYEMSFAVGSSDQTDMKHP
jgi:hypothetical protein